MEINQILKDLQAGNFKPIYFLCGDEEYYIDLISDYIEANALSDAEKEFNQTVLYGLETDVDAISAELKRFPMMSPYNVVIVKEAQNLKKWEELIDYFKNPSETSILVFNYKYKRPGSKSAAVTEIKKNGVYLESKKLYENQMHPWLEKEVKSHGFSLEPKAAALLVESIGLDLSKMKNELSKLYLNLKKGDLISSEVVEKNIGISKDFNVFELNSALGSRDVYKANKIIKHFAANPKVFSIPFVVGSLYRFFNQVLLMHTVKNEPRGVMASTLGVSPYFLSDYVRAAKNYSIKKIARIMSALRKADLHSKGYGDAASTNHDILKELIFAILH